MPDGIRPETYAGILPALPLVILGTASRGPLGQTRLYDSETLALDTLGGRTVARIPQPQSTNSLTFPNTFYPDDETLTQSPPWIYHCPTNQTYSVAYPFLTGLQGTGNPVQATFDPTGYDASVAVAPGGLFLECEATYSPGEKALIAGGNPRGGLLIPLLLALGESPSLPVAAIRVGSSWLPYGAPGILLPCGVTLNLPNQGSNDTYDAYLTAYASLTTTGLTLDPGLLGLPYVRRTYTFAMYPTWETLIAQVTADSQNGFIPFFPDSPGSQTASTATTQILFPSYKDAGVAPPDLTTAAAWAQILTEESPDLEDYTLVCLSGLTGKALLADPTSGQVILNALQDQILIVPWALLPTVDRCDIPNDAAGGAALKVALPSDRLLVIWGWGFSQTLPRYRGASALIPAAYSAACAISRESSAETDANPLRPSISTLSPENPFAIDVSSGVISFASPNPSDLETLRTSSLMPLTRGLSGWTLHGETTAVSGQLLLRPLCLCALSTALSKGLDPYVGSSESSTLRLQIAGTLKALLARFQTTPLGSFAAELDADLLDQRAPGLVEISCSLRLYNELRAVSFQISFSL